MPGKKPNEHEQLVSLEEDVGARIYAIRDVRVMLDFDLAELYDVETRVLNQAVTRNRERFPTDFMFRLSPEELEHWRSQFVMSNPAARMGLRRRPRAFTEQGVAMLSGVIRSPRAVLVNVAIMRAFVRMRDLLGTRADLERRLEDLEQRLETHDVEIEAVFDAIRGLMAPGAGPRKRIGFGDV